MIFLKLKMKMAEERYSQRLLAKKIKMPIGTLNSKMGGKSEFKLSEVLAIMEALGIPDSEFRAYFL